MKKFQTQNQDTNRGRDLDCITGPRPQNLSRKAVPFFFRRRQVPDSALLSNSGVLGGGNRDVF